MPIFFPSSAVSLGCRLVVEILLEAVQSFRLVFFSSIIIFGVDATQGETADGGKKKSEKKKSFLSRPSLLISLKNVNYVTI